jgi:tRNA(Ile)-lysidine synthase
MPVTNLVSRLRAEVARALAQLPTDTTLIAGVSGGPDSMCLADALLARWRTERVILAHFNHALRGAASDADADYVREFAQARGVRCVIERADVAALAAATGVSLELAGRDARYAFFARLATQTGAGAVLVAHHADDQAETVLFRMLRGTGIEGLRGMRTLSSLKDGPPGVALIRPLLRVPRADIEKYCADLGLEPRYDATNDALDATRNRLRHEVLPMLERINPGVRQVLARLADSAAAELDVSAYATSQAMRAVTQPRDDGIAIDRAAWRNLPEGMQRLVLRECVRVLKGELTNLNYMAIEEAREVLLSDAHSAEIALMADVRIAVAARDAIVRMRA